MFIGGSLPLEHKENTIRAWLDIGSGNYCLYIIGGVCHRYRPWALYLLPIAVALWGALATAISSIIGWFAGALIAFWLARTLGRPLVTRIVNLEKIARYERALEGKYVFWNLVFLRLVMPVDVLSYTVGFFTSIDFKIYALATLIGITPFAFVFSYASEAALPIRLGALLAVVVASFLGYLKVQRGRKTWWSWIDILFMLLWSGD